jgi:sterol desaturase/sphingolipid hydroxylase (fatty acid hydroxylase superfamily)
MLLENESLWRISVFAGVLLVMALLEALFPRKVRVMGRPMRWFTNLGIVVINTFAMRFVVPVLAMGFAAMAAQNGWGLLNLFEAPGWIEFVLAVLLLDMAIYWQHVLSHKIPIIWALHKVHHADRDIDTTTGLRFHPVEIILSMGYKIFWVLVLGPSVVAVFVFELLLNACALFNHANVKIPRGVDRFIRLFIVTPDMHRVHHSVIREETNSNYGFNLSVWDRLFGSYIDQPREGHDAMTIGLPQYQTKKPANLLWCLVIPFMPPYGSLRVRNSPDERKEN